MGHCCDLIPHLYTLTRASKSSDTACQITSISIVNQFYQDPFSINRHEVRQMLREILRRPHWRQQRLRQHSTIVCRSCFAAVNCFKLRWYGPWLWAHARLLGHPPTCGGGAGHTLQIRDRSMSRQICARPARVVQAHHRDDVNS